MSLGPGTRLGPYEIAALIGEGGMGEVWRAHHEALNRDDALKVLPDAFASDPERLARFRREAQVLASLNHPNIAHVYGFEQADGVQALVMELVEGPTLADRIASGLIPIDEALPIARQIAEALEAAHEQGITHRDLKPANIKIRPDGTVKVLDFGLAKAVEPVGATERDATLSPTITSPAVMTGIGVLLGTAAYMSPEQAKGKPADKRSDIWAFGCVLYEMLTGARAFDGDDTVDVLGAVTRLEPNWQALPSGVPLVVRTLLQSCLVKDRRRRVADISTALFVLDRATIVATEAAASKDQDPVYVRKDVVEAQMASAVDAERAAFRRSTRRRVVVVAAAAVLLTAVVVGGATWFSKRPAAPAPPRVSRLSVTMTSATALTLNGVDHDLTITPDGSHIVYVGNRGTQLFVRALDAIEPIAVYTGAPHAPFVSPDGQWIGFLEGTQVLRKVAMTGGPALTLATLNSTARGATWETDNTIIVATADGTRGLQRIAAGAGPATILTRPNHAQGETAHLWPQSLPGGRAVLFTISSTGYTSTSTDAAQVAVLNLETGKSTVLVRGGSHARYVSGAAGSPDGDGYLIYAAAGTLRAVPFDLARLETRGTPFPVVPDVTTTLFGAVDAAVADDGTLAYVATGDARAQRMIVWVDRQGHEEPVPLPAREYVYPRLSPDGTRAAIEVRDQEWDIWIANLANTALTRFSFDPTPDRAPIWTPDGRRIVWTSERSGVPNLYWQAASGAGMVERLTDNHNPQYAFTISPDGKRLVLREDTPSRDLFVADLDNPLSPVRPAGGQPSDALRPQPLIRNPAAKGGAEISPDGRWIAYSSDESGRDEIYVRPFPNVEAGRWQVSSDGGSKPLWARSGRELFYMVSSQAGVSIMSAPITANTIFASGTPMKVLEGPYFFGTTARGVTSLRTYDLSPDGRRFLMVKDIGPQAAAPPQLIVVQHFDEMLKRLVPTK